MLGVGLYGGEKIPKLKGQVSTSTMWVPGLKLSLGDSANSYPLKKFNQSNFHESFSGLSETTGPGMMASPCDSSTWETEAVSRSIASSRSA